MTFLILLVGLSSFFVYIGFHIVIWRWCRPKRDYLSLVLTALIPFPLVLTVIYFSFSSNFRLLSASMCLIDWVLIFLLYFTLCGAYIANYPGIQYVSPSLKILLLVGSAMSLGMTDEQIKSNFSDIELLGLKVQDLIKSKLVIELDDILRLTPKGVIMIRLFIFLRRILGLPIGRG